MEKQIQGLIEKLASDWFKKTGVDKDDLRGEGWLAYAIATQKDSPISDYYFRNTINYRMRLYCYYEYRHLSKQKSKITELMSEEAMSNTLFPIRDVEFGLTLNTLTKEAKEVIEVLLGCPQELIDFLDEEKRIPEPVFCKFFHKLFNWKWEYCQSVRNEIKEALAI